METKDRFLEWLNINSGRSQNTIDKYVRAITTMSKDISAYTGREVDIYNMKTEMEIDLIKDEYLSIYELSEKDRRGNRMYSSSFKWYKDFLCCEQGDKRNIDNSDSNESGQVFERKESSRLKYNRQNIIENRNYIGGRHMFIKGELYSREDIYELLNVPIEKRKGNWNTGYRKYNEEYFIFAGIDTTGRTGHDYNNHWEGDLLYWRGKNKSNFTHQSSKELISGEFKVHIFTRTDNKNVKFVYQGTGQVEKIEDTSPITVYWSLQTESKGSENILFERNESYGIQYRKKAITECSIKECEKYWKRDRKVVDNILKAMGYTCEEDITHCHFNSKATGMNYVEGHHLIPMKYQDQFEYSLDVEANVVSLCVVCHRKLHLANIDEKVDIIRKLYEARKVKLEESGIYITLDKLIKLYH